MDLLRTQLVEGLQKIAARRRCDRAQLWHWAGDGGFIVLHDDEESVARDVAVDYLKRVLEIDLDYLRREFAGLGIHGELRIRMALHRGTLRYRGEGHEGTVYSPDINIAAHLEKVALPDTAAVSGAAHRVLGDFARQLEFVGSYENHEVYVYQPGRPQGTARAAWLGARGLTGMRPVLALHERPSQAEKSQLIAGAREMVIDLGTALRTASRYLVTTERPAYFRDAVTDLLRTGRRYRCVLMDPGCAATQIVSEQRGEPLAEKIREAVADLTRFKSLMGADGKGLEVYFTTSYPGMAALAVDPHAEYGTIIYSPYLMAPPSQPSFDRGDMPHYLVNRAVGPMYESIHTLVAGFVAKARRIL